MPAECSADMFGFARVESRSVVASFDGGAMTSDAGGLLLGATDRAIGLIERFAGCFVDRRERELIEHEVRTLVGQRVYGLALGYEDLNDHDQIRHDPLMAVLAGKLSGRRKDCAAVAGKSTLNRLELSRPEPSKYHKISHDPAAIESLFVDLFMEAHERAPRQIVLDLDATDDPLHGDQEGRFFHGYYDCYCYLPLYIFCGRHLLAARLRPSSIDGAAGAVEETQRIVARIRRRWPRVRILLRADSGFAREALMAWCEANGVDYVLGLARNERLVGEIAAELAAAPAGPALQRLPVDHAQELEPKAPRDRQSRSHRRRGQPPLHRHLAGPSRDQGPPALRESLLRARRHGEPHQGMPDGPVRRPHLGRHHARQPAAPVVRRHGLRPALRPAPHRPGPYPLRQSELRHHPSRPPQDRRPRHHQRPPRQVRHGLGLSSAGRLPACPRLAHRRGSLTNQTALSSHAQRQRRTSRRPSARPHAAPLPSTDQWPRLSSFVLLHHHHH
jgi:Transposase DDE domain group 1